MSKKVFLLGVLFALAFAVSCSSGGSGGNDGDEDSRNDSGKNSSSSAGSNYDNLYWGDGKGDTIIIVQTIKNITEDSFTRIENYDCNISTGELKPYEENFNYSLENNTLDLIGMSFSYGTTTYNGTSNELKGVWTLSDDCNSNECLYRVERGEEILRVEFKDTTMETTQLICFTRGKEKETVEEPKYAKDGSIITVKEIDCNTLEFSAGNIKGTIKTRTFNDGTKILRNGQISYNRKSCTNNSFVFNNTSVFNGSSTLYEQTNACKKAYDTGGDFNDFYDILNEEDNKKARNFRMCILNSFGKEFLDILVSING